MAYSRNSHQTYNSPEVISHLRNLEFSIQPRYRLQQLKALLDETLGSEIIEDICSIDGGEDFTSSLKICQMKDKEKAALEGTPLTLETIVEDGFTHEKSVRLHLEVTSLTIREEESLLDVERIEEIWETMFEDEETKGIPGAQSIVLSWFSDNPQMVDSGGQHHLAEKLKSCHDDIKALSGYNDAFDQFV